MTEQNMPADWAVKRASRVIICPHTKAQIRVPAHYLAGPRQRGDLRQWMDAKGYISV